MKNPATKDGVDRLAADRSPYSLIDTDLKAALANTRQCHIDRILALGVTPYALATLGARQLPFGAMTIDIDDAGRWWPDPEGFPAIVLPVRERDDDIDIIAFRSTAPARWWWRIGCGSMLGADLLNDGWHEYPLTVVSTPLAWIAATGQALCILDWSMPDHEFSPLRDRVELSCDSPMLAARLRKRLAQPRKLPPITYPRKVANA